MHSLTDEEYALLLEMMKHYLARQEKSRGGGTPKLTAAHRDYVYSLADMGWTVSAMARKVGVSRQTVYKLLSKRGV